VCVARTELVGDSQSLSMRVLDVVQRSPMSITAICREINGRYKYFCGHYNCFANARKKKTMITFPCPCDVRRSSVLRAIHELERENLIVINREKRTDGKNNRGWDWMKIVYPTLKVAIGRRVSVKLNPNVEMGLRKNSVGACIE